MPRSYTQLFIHGIFAVKYRQALIDPSWEDELFSIMGGRLRELGHSPVKINGVTDHVHALWRHKSTVTVADTMRAIKGRSSHWINDAGLTEGLFRWQGGYGAFTVSVDRVPQVKRYIIKQKIHHKSVTVFDEYEKLLRNHGEGDVQEFMFDFLE